MELKSQCTSLEISKRLKELGVKQESVFRWDEGDGIEDRLEYIPEYANKVHELISAFTVAELGEMLPGRVLFKGEYYMLQCIKHNKWEVKYVTYRNGIGYVLDNHDVIQWGDEADARGKMLIYLLENKLITP